MVQLGDIATIKTGKLDSNAAEDGGIYPFFTCSPETLRINTFAFDQEAVILAGNNAEGNYTAKYYKGKFNAYQRTYIISSKDTNTYNNRFICYSINLALTLLKSVSQGTSTKFLTKSILNNLEIPEYGFEDQIKIVEIIGSIDDQIQCLSSLNDNLLQFARSEYNSFKNNNEYVSKPLSEVASFNAKAIKNKDSFKVINYLDTGSITSGIVTDYQHLDEEIDEIPSRAKRLVQPNDVIFSTVRPNQNHFGILTSIPDNCVVSTGFTTISSTNGSLSNEMIYLEITSEAIVAAMQQIAETSTSAYPSIRPEDLGEVEVPIFSNGEKLMKILSIIFQIIDENQKEIRSLNNLRDYLLPKLMSGQIDVSTLEIPN